VAFLARAEARYVTDATWNVHGGYALSLYTAHLSAA
jgi:hypothetical protein